MPDAYQFARLVAEILVSGILWVILSFIPEAWKERKRDPRTLLLLALGAIIAAVIFYYLVVHRWPFSD